MEWAGRCDYNSRTLRYCKLISNGSAMCAVHQIKVQGSIGSAAQIVFKQGSDILTSAIVQCRSCSGEVALAEETLISQSCDQVGWNQNGLNVYKILDGRDQKEGNVASKCS